MKKELAKIEKEIEHFQKLCELYLDAFDLCSDLKNMLTSIKKDLKTGQIQQIEIDDMIVNLKNIVVIDEKIRSHNTKQASTQTKIDEITIKIDQLQIQAKKIKDKILQKKYKPLKGSVFYEL